MSDKLKDTILWHISELFNVVDLKSHFRRNFDLKDEKIWSPFVESNSQPEEPELFGGGDDFHPDDHPRLHHLSPTKPPRPLQAFHHLDPPDIVGKSRNQKNSSWIFETMKFLKTQYILENFFG